MGDTLKIVLGVPEEIRPYHLHGKETGYSISNYGYFINNKTGKRLKNGCGGRKYYKVTLRNHDVGCNATVRVNRAVAETFIPNPENKPQVNHIDGSKLNNNVTNLEWATERENMAHAKQNNLVAYGDRCHKTVYSDEIVEQICQMLQDGIEAQEISKMLGVPKWRINSIKNGESRLRISSKYDLKQTHRKDLMGENNPSSIYSDALIHQVCKLIEAGYKCKYVINQTGITENMFRRVKSRKTRLGIVNQYNW